MNITLEDETEIGNMFICTFHLRKDLNYQKELASISSEPAFFGRHEAKLGLDYYMYVTNPNIPLNSSVKFIFSMQYTTRVVSAENGMEVFNPMY